MPPVQPASPLVSVDWVDQDQYARVYNLHPSLQSYSYDVVPGAVGYQDFGQPSSSASQIFDPLPSTRAVNNILFSAAEVNDPFQYGHFTTLTNVNDQSKSNVYEPLQQSLELPSGYTLQEADLFASSTGLDQSGKTFSPTYDVYIPAPHSYVPSLSQSTSVELPIDATAIPIAPPRPTIMSERSNEISPNLHGPIQSPEPNICQECTQSFPSTAELERHAKSLHHNAFKCKCGKPYARLDNLKRHWNQTPKFPCPHCKRYTGANAFRREDHLTQHLRAYHRIDNSEDENNTTTKQIFCTWPNCTQQQRPFGMKSQYTNHMRRIHNYSPFPCLVQGCVKTAGKGYFRERDLLKHSQEAHSVAED